MRKTLSLSFSVFSRRVFIAGEGLLRFMGGVAHRVFETRELRAAIKGNKSRRFLGYGM